MFEKERRTDRMRYLPFFRYTFFLAGLLLFLQIVLPSWRIMPFIWGREAVPLHYNIHFGVDAIGPWWRIYTVPLIGLLVLAVNFVAAQAVWKRESVLAYMIVGSTVFLEFMLLVAMVFIVLLNISYG